MFLHNITIWRYCTIATKVRFQKIAYLPLLLKTTLRILRIKRQNRRDDCKMQDMWIRMTLQMVNNKLKTI